jgi:ABC-2 type transport system permease protein
MKKILAIAKWEYLEKVKTKTFIISLVLTPLIILSFSLLPTLFADKTDERTKVIGIVDSSGEYFNDIRQQLESFKLEDEQPNYVIINLFEKNKDISEILLTADKEVLSGKIEGCLIIFNNDDDSLKAEYRSRSIGNFRDAGRIEKSLNDIRIERKLKEIGVGKNVLKFVQQNINVEQIKVDDIGKTGKQDFMLIFFSSFIFILLLMMMVIYSGQMLVRSLIEEKSNRLIEVIVSSCSSDQLLAGKILGLSSLGLTQIFIWMIIGLSLVGGSVVPVSVFENLHLTLIYFVLGFIFYSTLFVGIGSVLSTEQEAQQITTYLTLILMFPVVIAVPAMQNPDSTILKVFSYIPLTIPTTMILRINISQLPISEFIITAGIMLISIFIMIKISAKLFRIGILSYGARPSVKELIQWIKTD